jgi:hypothetical protein
MKAPTLQYAIFCRKVIERGEGQKIEGFFNTEELFDSISFEKQKISKSKPMLIRFFLVLGIVGLSFGPHKLIVNARFPSGELMGFTGVKDIDVVPGPVIWRIVVNMSLQIIGQGIYTFPILLDGEPLIDAKLPIIFT